MPGVIAVVRDGDFLGLAAEREEQAIKARELLKKSARWKESESLPPSGDALYEHLMTKAKSVDSVVNEKTSVTVAAPAKTLNATYTRPFQVHGSIGPSCAVAQWREGKLTVWTHSQGVFPLRGDLAKVFATDPANVHCIPAAADRGRRPQLDPALRFPEPESGEALPAGDAAAHLGLAHARGYSNVFALESFIDELALAAGADPVEFRLRHLKDPRARAAIEAAAQRSGWRPNAKGDGARGRGFAFAKYKNLACYVAVVADVEVDRASGKVRVTRAVAAVDAGQIVNPDGVVNQIEGGIIQSTSWTLLESVRYDRTRVTTRSWADYPIIHFGDVPQVEVVLLDRPEERFLGVGEGSQGPAAAAIANAIAHATGRRLRALPFTPERVKQALA